MKLGNIKKNGTSWRHSYLWRKCNLVSVVFFSAFIRPTFNVGLMKPEKLQPRTLKKVRLCLTNGNLVNNYNTIRWEGARRVSSPIGGPFLWSQTFDWTNCLLMDFWGLQLYGSFYHWPRKQARFSFGATRITDICCQETARWHQPKREDYYPSHFSESAKTD